jgi:broad specificity phosphatase PhoE
MTVTRLWLVRHGESAANIAAAGAELDDSDVIRVEHRDADVPLSETGVEQARAFGSWLGEHAPAVRLVAFASPYLRARQTAELAIESAGLELGAPRDERLRDRELGVLDLLTTRGVESRFPDEAIRRRWVQKFYYRPPGGESWADVALRLRSFLRDIDDIENADAALVVSHDAVVMNFLYVCLNLDEHELLDFSQQNTVLNASVTVLSRAERGAPWELAGFSLHDHLKESGVPVTVHSGDKDAEIHE